MSDFLKAYSERMQANDKEFRKIAEELKLWECKVFVPKDRLINYIKIFAGNRHIIFGFDDVPYRWYLDMCLKPSKENGSSRRIKEIPSTDNPFTIPDILSKMKENPNIKDFTNPNYLKQL